MMSRLGIQLVNPDGCFVLRGLRVRAAPGWHKEPGSLACEAATAVQTPLAGEAARDDCLACCGSKLREFVESLPDAELRPSR